MEEELGYEGMTTETYGNIPLPPPIGMDPDSEEYSLV